MNARVAILVALLGGLMGRSASAQTTVVAGPNGAAPFSLETLNGGDPFRASAQAGSPRTIADSPSTTAVLHSDVGFSYLRPYWPSSGQALRVPASSNAAVPVINPIGNLTNQYGFVPRLDLSYATAAVELGLSFQYLAIGGNLNRTLALDSGSANLLSAYNLSILVINPIELSKPFSMTDLSDHDLVYRLGLDNDVFVASVGLRYQSIRQDFHASLLASGSGLANSDATQNFNGLGLTIGLTNDHPVSEHWGLYSISRTSLLLGLNSRASTSAGTGGTGPYSNVLNETKTNFFPVQELELGLRYLAPLKSGPDAESSPLLSLRVGFVGQFYSGIGFLPAASGTAQFDDRNLYLVGFSVMAGLIY